MSYGPGSPACEAFKAAAKEWCAKPPGKRGSFNDKFFKKLKRKDKDLFKRLSPNREAAAIFRNGQFQGMARDLAVKPPALPVTDLQTVATRMTTAFNSATGNLNGARQAARLAAWSAQGVNLGSLFAALAAAKAAGTGIRAAGSALGAVLRNSYRTRFFDAMDGGTPVEIKGPGDSYGKGQKQAMKKAANPKNKIIEISCKSCGVKGSSGCDVYNKNN